ncbi:M20 aminoacylase family protein [uncultured Bartonella sp.]|uniref:M20 aminoacylase family protein n=1 Tax=uncultured Bartonella sp. TaxID=104108 RepID=UPI0025CB8C15|nr:M20 aminoacylase family protein [uncultured Bartonella sp.]
MATEAIKNLILSYLPEMTEFRHAMHENPELSRKETATSARIATLLEQYGYEVTRHIGGNGIVASLKNGNGRKSIGIRADMDALPIREETDLEYASKNEGVMHACGHDGHTTTLLTAARALAATKNFDGTVHLIFQPAEEIGAGAKAMINDGLFERFPCDAVYGLHNWPGLEQGKIQFTKKAMMASVDKATIVIYGKGGHGARPESAIDPIVVASSIVMALQTILSRNVPPLQSAIISTGSIHGGEAFNIIPDSVTISLTVRSFSADIQNLVEERIKQIVEAQAKSFGATASVNYERLVPAVVNHPEHSDFALHVAKRVLGADRVVETEIPTTVSEDFAFMLEARPGAFFFLGNGESASLHSPHYNFNDQNIIDGAVFWCALVEESLNNRN